jgi:predicted MFS family arabinose efflux permease
LVSLILQATGGALASSSSQGGYTSDETGNHIMMAGLIFQVVTLSVFICLAGDFVMRTYLARGNLQAKDSPKTS